MIFDGSFFDISKGIVIGLKDFESKDEEKLKKTIEDEYSNFKFIDLNKVDRKNKENIKKEQGMISKKWIEKIIKDYPCICIFCFCVNEELKNNINDKLETQINKTINCTLNKVYGDKQSVYYKFIIVYIKVKFKNNVPFVKNILKDYFSKLNLIIEDTFSTKIIIEKINRKLKEFYNYKINLYTEQLNDKEIKEILIKKNIKIGIFYNLIGDSQYFNYFEKAYNLIKELLNEKKYSFCEQDERLIYFELRNISDWLLLNIYRNNGLSENNTKKKLLSHFSYFNVDNFLKNENISHEIKINYLFWKLKHYEYFIQLKTKFSNDNFLQFGKIHSLMRLIKYYFDNKKQIQLINIDYKTEEIYPNYVEKFPVYKNDTNKIIDIQEIIKIYYCNLIEKNIINFDSLENELKRIIKDLFNNINNENEKFSFYHFQIISIMNFVEENKKEYIKFLKDILNNSKSHYLQIYYPKIYHDLLNKYNKIMGEEITNIKDKFLNIMKKSYFGKLTDEENNFLNQFFNNNNLEEIEANNLTNFKLHLNEIFNVDFSFSNNRPKILDIVTLKFELKTYLDNSIKIPIKEIKLFGTNQNHEFLSNQNFELSNSNPLIRNFKIFACQNYDNLSIKSIDIKLQNGITFSYSISHPLNKTIILNKFDNKDLDKYIIINYRERYETGVSQYEYISINISNNIKDKIKITEVKSCFNLVNEDLNLNFEYEFYIKDKNNVLIKKLNEKLNIENIKLNEDNSGKIEFILRIHQIGKYKLNFNIQFNIISLELENLSIYYNCEKKLNISINYPIKCTYELLSPITFGTNKNQLSFIPTSYPFKIKAYLTNLIDNDVIIKNLEIIPSNNSINISSPLIKLLEKNIQQIIQFNCKFIIPFHIFISENFEGEIGKFTVKWSTHDLENYSNELMNVVEYHFKENIHKQKIITKKNDWNFFIEIIDFNLKIIIENLSDEIKNILLKLEVNKENPDYLIEGKVKKKTLVYPSSKHTESFLIIPLRNQLRTIKINHIYIQEFPLDDKLNKNCKIIYNFNPGFININ